jgi:hypothetical protein
MDSSGQTPIPSRAETLKVLQLMGKYAPILMLGDDANGFGTRWSIDGHPVQPPIAKYLMQSGYIAESGATEFGARTLALTEAGAEFREDGLRWWKGLSLFQKLQVMFRG